MPELTVSFHFGSWRSTAVKIRSVRDLAARVGRAFAFGIVAWAVVSLTVGCGKDDDDSGAVLVEYEQLKVWMEAGEDIVLIDVRKPTDFAAGHLQDAINVDYEALVDGSGNLIDDGAALTNAVPDKSKRIVAYCFGYGLDKDFAEHAVELGYTAVHRYEWGTNEWSKRDYLVIDYGSFKAWHDPKSPFNDGKSYLIDDLPQDWYSGDDPDHPGGHIPGAVNLPIEKWGGNDGPIDGGKALMDVVKDKSAKVVIYCGNMTCGKSLVGAKTALALGYTNVFRYQGGWQEWQDKGNVLKPGLDP